MRHQTTRPGRNAAYLDDMKNLTPSRATVENAIAKARASARQAASKKPKAASRNVVRPFPVKTSQSALEPDQSTGNRSVDWQPEPSPSKKPSSPTQEFFQNVFASRSTTSPVHDSRGRESGHNSRAMADPPASLDAPAHDAPSKVPTKSADEQREDGNTVNPAPRNPQRKGDVMETFEAEKLELQSVAETEECDFGLGKRNLPSSPSMKSDNGEEENEEDWELKGIASEETLKATGNARRTRPHKGTFVRKGKKKTSYDDEDGKVIRSLFSVDSSIAPINALFEDEEEEDFEDDVLEVKPRKADPPDSSPVEVAESNPANEEEMKERSDLNKTQVPWDRKGTSLGHVEKLVASIKAKKALGEAQSLTEKTEDLSTEASDSKQGEVHEESGEYEDFVGDFLQSGSGDDAPLAEDEAQAESYTEAVEGSVGEAENESLIIDEVKKCESQNAFLEQFEALGIIEESTQKKLVVAENGVDETLNESCDAITEWRVKEEKVAETDVEATKEDTREKGKTLSDQEYLAEKDVEDSDSEVQDNAVVQAENAITNIAENAERPNGEVSNAPPAKVEVETVLSADDSVGLNECNQQQGTTSHVETEQVAVTGLAKEEGADSSISEENQAAKEQTASEVEDQEEEMPEEPVHIFKFAKGISKDDWQEKYEMASEWQYKSSSLPLDGVTAAENLHRFTNPQNSKPEPRPWKVSYKQRTRNHPGFKNIDIYSVLESTKVTLSGKPKDDYIPWEHRDVKQRFLQERSVEFSRNWYGKNHKRRVNSRFKLPICRPRSMEMPIVTSEDAVEWSKDVYTTWKSPYQKIEHQRLKLHKSEDDEDNRNEILKQSHLVDKTASKDDDDSEYDDEGSYSDGSYSDGSYTGTEGSYDDDEGSYYSSVASEKCSPVIVDDNGTVASWEDAPECGQIINMKLKIGEHVTRVHPVYTSSLRRSRWRKKYFPKGSFPY